MSSHLLLFPSGSLSALLRAAGNHTMETSEKLLAVRVTAAEQRLSAMEASIAQINERLQHTATNVQASELHRRLQKQIDDTAQRLSDAGEVSHSKINEDHAKLDEDMKYLSASVQSIQVSLNTLRNIFVISLTAGSVIVPVIITVISNNS